MAEKKQAKQKWTLARVLPYILVIGGIIGLISSYILIFDQVKIWENPHYVPACSLNPVVSCGSVINSKQGEVFGIPGPFFGLISFAVLTTIGFALLAGAKFKRWFWLGLELGVISGIGYALWLFWLSMYRVHALCPFCLTVDIVVYTTFWYVTLYNIDQRHIRLPEGKLIALYAWIRRHHLDILVLWFFVLAFWILKHFWYYYGRNF